MKNFIAETDAGSVGIASAKGCGEFGKSVYTVDSGAYAGVNNYCFRVLLNHRKTSSEYSSSYVQFRAVGYYFDKKLVDTSIVLMRKGLFVRGGNEGIGSVDLKKSYASKVLSFAEFDRVTGVNGALADNDSVLGLKFHGSPKGNPDHDTWSDRERFKSETILDNILRYKDKIVDNKIIRFEPYESHPSDGPVSVEIYPKGADLVFVSVYSPYYPEREVGLILVMNESSDAARRALDLKVGSNCTKGFFDFFMPGPACQ